ncbi:polysaccharide pyruvyl transferase family protein [Selenomonas sp. WCA-380-WT-3B 3/]|uniref:Polysaccharide pyruvyl transferase family protein n=1 Tax=Selenomonas montiformis TaxID=2652285 RepID=A0A6I2V0R9_9FIRM|nr:polysaccharide pyruvyl transferase family protein [Selenomonas montiformis]MSV25954.1 polysaccharide pyruvyl transferase family protein [Selenomonas montiformis]
MKIAIFTIIGRGPGTKLQNYALQTYLENTFNAEVKTIRRSGYYYYPLIFRNCIRNFSIKDFARYIIKKSFRIQVKYEKRIQANWIDFDHNINYTDYSCKKTSAAIDVNLNDKFDYFVVGSDQVWNYNWYSDINYFKHIDSKKCLSYAASFGVYDINNEQADNAREALNHLKGISVREDAGMKIAEKLTNKLVVRNIDPTFLLDREDWKKIAKKPKNDIDKNYIVAFFLGNISKERHDRIEKLAKEKDCEVMWILRKEYPLWEDFGPAEFLYSISHAKGVVTDSFHGTVFSIIFRKPFYSLNRDQNLQNMNSRLDTVLNLFSLQDRHVFDENMSANNFLFTYSDSIDNVIERERENAKKYFERMFR